MTPSLRALLDDVNERFESNFNGILVNRYEGGSEYIGAHSDNEKELSNNGVVAISYGATRTFRIRDKKTNKRVIDLPMESGCMIHMSGDFQSEFKHEVPVQKRVQGTRYSFTFRRHK